MNVIKFKEFFQLFALFFLLTFIAGASWAETDDRSTFHKGLTSFRNSDFKSALKAFEEFIQTNPNDAEAHFYLGLTHNRFNAYADAVLALEKAHELNPQLPGVHLNLGISYYKLKTYGLALMSLNRALSESPDSGSANFFIGLTCQGKGQYEQSIPYFNKAKIADPDFAQMSWYYIGLAYYKTERRTLAQKALKNAIDVDPTSEIAKEAKDILAVLPYRSQGKKRWWLKAEIGCEYDDNLTVVQADFVSDEDDYAAVFELNGGVRFMNQPIEGEISYDFYQSLYGEFSQLNMQSHRFGVSGNHDFDKWDFSLDYDYTYMFLGNDGFMQTHSVMPTVGLSVWSDLYTNLSYIGQVKDFIEIGNKHRDAQNHSVGSDFFLLSLKRLGMVQFGLRYENENAVSDELDYAGLIVTSSLRLTAPLGVKVRPSYKYQLRNYSNITASIEEKREDVKQTFSLALTKKIFNSLKLKLNYKYIDSDSNYSSSDYKENVVYCGLAYSM